MSKRRVFIELPDDAEQLKYLDACARIRDINMSVLLRRLISVIAEDQMVLNVLDDDSRPYREKQDWGYRESANG